MIQLRISLSAPVSQHLPGLNQLLPDRLYPTGRWQTGAVDTSKSWKLRGRGCLGSGGRQIILISLPKTQNHSSKSLPSWLQNRALKQFKSFRPKDTRNSSNCWVSVRFLCGIWSRGDTINLVVLDALSLLELEFAVDDWGNCYSGLDSDLLPVTLSLLPPVDKEEPKHWLAFHQCVAITSAGPVTAALLLIWSVTTRTH